MAYLVCAQVPAPANELLPRLLVAVASAALAWLLTMSGWAFRHLAGNRSGDLFKQLPRTPLLRPNAFRDAQVWLTILQNLVGVLAAGSRLLRESATPVGPWSAWSRCCSCSRRGQARLTRCVLTRCALTASEVHRFLSASP